MSRTVGALVAEARHMLNDTVPISGEPRYEDAELLDALNEGLLQVRAKRPDAFLRYGLRRELPVYALPDDAETVFPVEDQFYSPLLFYVVGRSELTEDTFSNDSRAATLLTKFTSQLLRVAS